ANVAFSEWLLDQATELAPLTSDWRALIRDLQTEDYEEIQAFSDQLDPRRQAILAFKQAQPLRVEVVNPTSLSRLNRHIELLEHSHSLDKAWAPASDMLLKALATRGLFYLYDQHEPAEALKDFDAILAIQPHNVAALTQRGVARQRMKQPEDALTDFNQVLQSHSNDFAARFGRAQLLAERGDYKEALEDFDEVQRHYPKDTIALQKRGETRHRAGNFRGARLDLAQALAFRPTDPDLLISSARVSAIKGDDKALKGALKALNHAITLRPDDPEAYAARGKLIYEHELADVANALSDLNKSLELRPDDAATLYERARIHMHRHNWTNALADLDRSLELNPNNPAALT
ncbi:MAG TPA: tetratricopeptide repeat protein, partial [Roseiflexaceae bacterium]|nr:tetratricopeptide repeat protein [Roseiflexaceae bacterium]